MILAFLDGSRIAHSINAVDFGQVSTKRSGKQDNYLDKSNKRN